MSNAENLHRHVLKSIFTVRSKSKYLINHYSITVEACSLTHRLPFIQWSLNYCRVSDPLHRALNRSQKISSYGNVRRIKASRFWWVPRPRAPLPPGPSGPRRLRLYPKTGLHVSGSDWIVPANGRSTHPVGCLDDSSHDPERWPRTKGTHGSQ